MITKNKKNIVPTFILIFFHLSRLGIRKILFKEVGIILEVLSIGT